MFEFGRKLWLASDQMGERMRGASVKADRLICQLFFIKCFGRFEIDTNFYPNVMYCTRISNYPI